MITGIIGSSGLDPRSFDPRLKNEEVRPPLNLSAVPESEVRSVEEISDTQQPSKNLLDTFA